MMVDKPFQSSSAKPSRKGIWSTLPKCMQNFAYACALGFGSGLIRPASGTWGTLAGMVFFLPFASLQPFSPLAQAMGLAVVLALVLWGMYACHLAGIRLGKADHASIVWDEMVAIWMVLVLAPNLAPIGQKIVTFLALPFLLDINRLASSYLGADAFTWALAFLLFRFCDIVKPYPANWIDRHCHHGVGVMMDDLVAGSYTVLGLWALTLI